MRLEVEGEIGTEASPRGTGVRSAIGGWPTHHVAIPITASDESLHGASIGKADDLMRWVYLAASTGADGTGSNRDTFRATFRVVVLRVAAVVAVRGRFAAGERADGTGSNRDTFLATFSSRRAPGCGRRRC